MHENYPTENQNVEQSLVTGDEEAELVANNFLTKLPEKASIQSKQALSKLYSDQILPQNKKQAKM